MRPRVIGLDLSLTATGVAFVDGDTKLLYAKAITGMPRLDFLRRQILDVCQVGMEPPIGAHPDLVVIEGYSMGTARQSSHAHALGELGGVVRLALFELGIDYVDVAPATLKKYATGKGNANKELVLVEAVKRLGYQGSDNNEADALWLRAIGLAALGHAVVDLPQTHMAALSAVHLPNREEVA